VTTAAPTSKGSAALSLAEAADLLGVTDRHLRILYHRGEPVAPGIPILRMGRRYIVPRAPLLRLLGLEAS
jgi:excisionase family DNA binding protein